MSIFDLTGSKRKQPIKMCVFVALANSRGNKLWSANKKSTDRRVKWSLQECLIRFEENPLTKAQ